MANIIQNLFRHGGYLKADDRCSGGVLFEDDIKGCGHCHAVLPKRDQSKKRTGLLIHAHCSKCDTDICADCGIKAEQFGCVTMEAVIMRAMADAYRIEQNAKILGI